VCVCVCVCACACQRLSPQGVALSGAAADSAAALNTPAALAADGLDCR